jgi:aerobic C4-dicarboxylate transport protein
VLIGSWTGTLDRAKAAAVLHGAEPFDELTMLDSGVEQPSATPV